MGLLVPEDFDLKMLANDAERIVVEALCDQLTDGWIVMPSVQLARKRRNYEIDVVLAHATYGVAVLEIKGHRPSIKQGMWYAHGEPMDPQPVRQVLNNAGAVRDELQSHPSGDFEHLKVPYAVVLPNCSKVQGEPPRDLRPHELWCSPVLEDIAGAVEDLFIRTSVMNRFSDVLQRTTVETLLPSATFSFDPEAGMARSRARLEKICATNVRVLERLDANRKVVVTGGAGTGKTRLALAWARRALTRGDRVLLTCFNEPLADQMKFFLGSMAEDEDLTVGPFLRIAPTLPGMPPIEIPEFDDYAAETQFWNVTMVSHLHNNWPLIADRFDTIIIDEAQDFSPAWVAQLESLLDPDGPRRVLMVGDVAQDVFGRGFSLPVAADGWTIAELTYNCRNTFQIARLLRKVLGGAISPQAGPEAQGISLIESTGSKDDLVATVQTLLNEHEGGRSAVITKDRATRDLLRRECALGPWEADNDGPICETWRKLKGTEFDFVIVVDPDGEMDDQSLYVAISRAVNKLAIIGSMELIARFQ